MAAREPASETDERLLVEAAQRDAARFENARNKAGRGKNSEEGTEDVKAGANPGIRDIHEVLNAVNAADGRRHAEGGHRSRGNINLEYEQEKKY